jgi:hypothetical protein
MPQPRKEQVKNLKTKYTRLNDAGYTIFGGGPTQVIPEFYYDSFLLLTRTGVADGAETSSPSILYGGNGPFSLVAGNSFTIALPGVNGGAPVTVAIQAGDVTTLGVTHKVTTARLAARINTALAAYSVTEPVGANVDGQLVLTGATAFTSTRPLGDSATITLADITPGIISSLGFLLSSITGTSAPRRGFVTRSTDGLGGYVQVRQPHGEAAQALNQCMRHIGNWVYVPETVPGGSVFARVKAVSAPPGSRHIDFTFYRQGLIGPLVTGNLSNFGAIVPGDDALVRVGFDAIDPGNPFHYNFHIVFSSTPTSVQDVIDKVNSSYGAGVTDPGGCSPLIATVRTQTPAPYTFTDPSVRDSFFISFNGQPSIHINPPSTVSSASDFVTYINSRITAEAQASQGSAFLTTTGGVEFRSLNTNPTIASVAFLPGNPGGSSPGTFMETLSMLGIAPGIYRASFLASSYGADEIVLSLPPGSYLAMVNFGFSGPIANMGFPTPFTTGTADRLGKVVAPTVQLLVPEMVEFSEEPDDYDPEIQLFDIPSNSQIISTDGIKNIGIPALLDASGRINESFLPILLSFLNLDTLRLGERSRAIGEQTTRAKIQLPQTGNAGYVLVYESKSTVVTDPPVRLYVGSGAVVITSNARAVWSGSTTWFRDLASSTSTMLEIKVGQISSGWQSSASWADTAWNRNNKLLPTGISAAALAVTTATFGTTLNGSLLADGSVSVPCVTEPFVPHTVTGTSPTASVSLDSTHHSFTCNSTVALSLPVTITAAPHPGAKYVLWFSRTSGCTLTTFQFIGGPAPAGIWSSPVDGASYYGRFQPVRPSTTVYDLFVGQAIDSSNIAWTVYRYP